MLLLFLLVLYQVHSFFIRYDNQLVEYAIQYAGTIEEGNNRGQLADSVNEYVGNPIGSPYCMAFVFYCIDHIKPNTYKKTGLATAFRGKKLIKAIDVWTGKAKVKAGNVIIWQKGSSIFGHAGISISDWDYISGATIQGNTTFNGKQGVFIKQAIIEPYNYYRIIKFWEI